MQAVNYIQKNILSLVLVGKFKAFFTRLLGQEFVFLSLSNSDLRLHVSVNF